MTDRTDQRLTVALMIESVLLGGAEMVVLQMAGELRQRGHSVHLVVPAGRDGWMVDQFRASGFAWHTYDLRRPIDWELPGQMARMLRGLEVDVVHSHEFVMAVYGAAAARRIGRTHVITMHGNQNMTTRFRRRVALRWAFRNSRATVAVSTDTRRHLETTLKLRDDVVQVIHNGIPVRSGDRERTRRELQVGPNELLLLSVGSLVPRKGHAVLLNALARLHSVDAPKLWRLAIAGEGTERPHLEGMIRDLGLESSVRLLGPRNDIPDLQAAVDIFLMPSLSEGLPLAILEAMFAGTAIIASRTSGIPEAIEDGRHGLLVRPGDADAIAAALARVMSDPAYRAQLGEAARRHARESFTIEVMTDRYERLYRGGRGGS